MAEVINFVVHYLEKVVLMTVSRKKSNVIASKPSIANAIAEAVHDEVVKAASHAKVLGVDTVGGCKRYTFQQRSRIWKFSGMQAKFSALREVGLDVAQMVRAIAPPLMLYGVENIGISDNPLAHSPRQVRSGERLLHCWQKS